MLLADRWIIGFTAHLVADWLLQNHWMAANKLRLDHPAAWIHAFIHFCAYLLIFPLPAAALLALIHMLIDTRVPLRWWFKFYGQSTHGEYAVHVAIWADQVLHILVLTLAVYLF